MSDNSAESAPRGGLSKELRLFDVYALATGATLSAGLFLLPGLAAAQVGPAIVFCYLLAAVPLVPAMLSIVELSTAMPRAGGAYYFIDRSLGPLAGTIGGLGTWLALVLKTSFALIGMGAYVALFVDASDTTMRLIASGFAIAFGLLNALGSSKTGGFQVVLVTSLLGILVLFLGTGVTDVDLSRFQGFFGSGKDAILATTGMVYISYVGVTNVASVSEEVRDPERNLPLGVFLSLGTAILVYGVATFVLVGVVPMDELQNDLTPMASAARRTLGGWGVGVIAFAALIAFSSVANAGILSSSRYPLAMSRDHLVPGRLGRLSGRGTPVVSIALTVGAILVLLLLLEPAKIAKLASAFQLLMFALLCMAVIVMRESRIESYDPGYRAPFYPWMQIVGILSPMVLIAEMGWLPTLFSAGTIAVGIAWYFYYAAPRVARHGAIFHVFARLGEGRHEELDRELRTILKEKGLRDQDPFDEVVLAASVIDVEEVPGFENLIEQASDALVDRLPCDRTTLVRGFTEGTLTGATPVAKGVALPHMRMDGLDAPHMVLVRCRREIRISTGDVFGTQHMDKVHAVFFLVSPEDDPGRHLRMLAQLASRIDQDDFLHHWLAAADDVHLKEIFLRDDRSISIRLLVDSQAAEWIGREVRDLELPEGCLVTVVRRMGETLIPRGSTRLAENDRLLILGETQAIAALYEVHGD
ncbi:MAG: amino acid permease [bacterium]|nr:amino acid permease [bacterium]